MAVTSQPTSDEAQPLNTRPSRIAVETNELRNQSFDGRTPPLLSPTSTTYHSEHPEGEIEADPAYLPIDSQHPQQHGMRNQGREHRKQSDKRIQRLWLWESLSLAVATLALTAIVITLVLQKDRPLPDWPSAITINALIAVFTAIFKACLMMPIAEGIGQLKWLWYEESRPLRHMEQWDSASRGPWGSLLLIPVLSYRDFAVIGAILTILAMAVDPFTQQVVQPYSCSRVIKGESATVPYSNNYTAGFSGMEGESQLDPQMESAMYVGLLDPPANTSAALEFECRTGNCSFPSTDDGATFLSLALESRCADIGSDVVFSIRNFTGPYNQTLTELTANIMLPGYSLQLGNWSGYVMQSGSRTPTDRPSHFLEQIVLLMISSDWGYRAEPQDTHAFECKFYPAVNTYSANITNGVLLEQVLDSQRMDVSAMPHYISHALFMVNRTIREGKWHECTENPEPSEEHSMPVSHGLPHDPRGTVIVTELPPEMLTDPSNNIMWWPRDCVYWLPSQTLEGLSDSISNLLGSGNLSYNWPIERPAGSPWSVNLWNNGTPTLDTVQAIMDGMTRSVTARLRQGDGFSVNIGPLNGMVWGSQTCVRVKWMWLALPAGLLLLTIVFLFLTIIKTRSRHARIWKSSIFAVLYSGLDEQTRQADGRVASLEEMKAAADRATVRLEDTKEGLRLVGQV